MNTGTLVVGGGEHITIPVEGVNYDVCIENAMHKLRSFLHRETGIDREWATSEAGHWYISGSELRATILHGSVLSGEVTFTRRPHERDDYDGLPDGLGL